MRILRKNQHIKLIHQRIYMCLGSKKPSLTTASNGTNISLYQEGQTIAVNLRSEFHYKNAFNPSNMVMFGINRRQIEYFFISHMTHTAFQERS